MKKPPMTPDEASDLLETILDQAFLAEVCPVCKRPFSAHSSADVAYCEPKLAEAIAAEDP